MQPQMKVCYFGSYFPNYSRNRIIIRGLRQNGVEVFECQDGSTLWLRYFKLLWQYVHLEKHNAIVVGTQGHTSVPLAWVLAKLFRRVLVFDPFISLWDTAVFDREEVKKTSLKAKYYYYLDKWSCGLADEVIVDTQEQLKHFHKEFGIPERKMGVVYVGADDNVFSPVESKKSENKKDNGKFTIFFYGTFIPVHGIQYIVRAAKLLEEDEDIKIKIMGRGQTYPQIRALSEQLGVKNITFFNSVAYETLPPHLATADICLGIFGNSEKARRAIPNKACDAVAMKKPLITGDSPGVREVFVDKETVFLCEMANPQSLADAILGLKEDEELRNKIAEGGYELYKEKFTPKVIGKEVKTIIEKTRGAV